MPVDVKLKPWWKKALKLFRLPWKTRLRSYSDVVVQEPMKRSAGRYNLRPEMIRRVEGAPKLVDPSGWISEGVSEQPSENATPTRGAAQGYVGEAKGRVEKEGSRSSSGENTDETEVERKDERWQVPEEERYACFAGVPRD